MSSACEFYLKKSSNTSPLRRHDFRHQQVQLIFNDFLFLGD